MAVPLLPMVIFPVLTEPKPVSVAPLSIFKSNDVAVGILYVPPSSWMVPLVMLSVAPTVRIAVLPISSVWLLLLIAIAVAAVAVPSIFKSEGVVLSIAKIGPLLTVPVRSRVPPLASIVPVLPLLMFADTVPKPVIAPPALAMPPVAARVPPASVIVPPLLLVIGLVVVRVVPLAMVIAAELVRPLFAV